ncbi:MAG: hypothetical protein WA913_11155 [Pricia sp.]
MLSFFTILLILVGANALFMIFSLAGPSNGAKKSAGSRVEPSSSSKVYPMKSVTSKLKKAV